MRTPLARSLGLSLLLATVLIAFGHAQSARGSLRGVVTDAGGVVLPGVRVSLSGPARSVAMSNARGEFEFQNLAAGAYELRFELAGFATAIRRVSLASGSLQRIDVRMEAAAAADQSKAAASPGAVNGVGGGIPRQSAAERVNGAPFFPAPSPSGSFNTEAYDSFEENRFRRVADQPLSTFSVDVDTASYANVRRFLNEGRLPPPGAVRIEELVNYFHFSYPQPAGDAPFSVTTELAACPWSPTHQLALIGLQGRAPARARQLPRNLVFLIDVSGSMNAPDKLPLVQNAMQMLADTLTAADRVAIVVYAGASGLVLPPTRGDQKLAIRRAVADLRPGGSTNGAAGIKLAYRIAREQFVREGVNRVMLATDGDFNVGVTSQDELVRLIEEERESGVFLSVLGVGTGNLKDSTMEKLADKGNGNYSYLDSLHEARRVLVHEAGGTLVTIAKDVKIQIEFNPRTVAGYRLIGYENRVMRNEDFNDDRKDAGDIGAGHSVTALYEIVPAGVPFDDGAVDPLKYQQPPQPSAAASPRELATIKLRYKRPDADESKLISVVLGRDVRPMPENLGFASAVAEFGMVLRGSTLAGSASLASALARAERYRGVDPDGYRAEFVRMVDLASGLSSIATK